MTKSIVVALDHAKLGTLLDATVERGLPAEQRKNKLFAVLDAALATNDKILYVPGVEDSELKNSIADEFFDDFQSWIKERTYQNRVLKAKSVKREKDRQKFDPDKKRIRKGVVRSSGTWMSAASCGKTGNTMTLSSFQPIRTF